jgi:heat-inducible transcriptional repressor
VTARGDNMITKRQQDLLKLITREYVRTAKPISSKELCDELDCSSATIRNEMSELEELGFISKTHTSSGRIPSEKGYRYYVDHLMEPKKMTGEDMLKLQTIFHNQSLQLNDAILKSMEIISEITNYTSVILGSSGADNNLKQVDIVPINEDKIVALVVTDKGHVENKQIDIPVGVSLNEIKQTVGLINKLLIGTPINEISSKLEFEIKPIIGKYVKQHESLYQAFYNAFSDFKDEKNISMLGKTNFLKLPEFDNVGKMREIITKFEDKDLITGIECDDTDIKVYIGSENSVDEDLTVIKTHYSINGEEGTIAIMGPKRMDYDRVVYLLEYIKENIGG